MVLLGQGIYRRCADGRSHHPHQSRVSGRVIYAPLEENTFVKAGTVLVKLDPADYEIALHRAEADLGTAEAAGKAARTNVPIASANTEAQLSAARAGVNEARAGVDVANREVDNARAALNQAEAGLTEARSNFNARQPIWSAIAN